MKYLTSISSGLVPTLSIVSLLSFSACGKGATDSLTRAEAPSGTPASPPSSGNPSSGTPTQVSTPNADGSVVRARITYPIVASDVSSRSSTGVEVPVGVTLQASVVAQLDTAGWSIPTIQNGVMYFGVLGIGNLFDNDLMVCGDGHQKCRSASIRIYTTGQSGSGLWNTQGGYGAPINVGITPDDTNEIGLEAAHALTLQTISIPDSKNVIRHGDFSPVPYYNFLADFTNAGAGTYATTLVIEYVLSR